MKLSDLQDAFQSYLIEGKQTAISPVIENNKRFNAERGLKVYFDGYRLRLLEILKLDFPKTYAMMGDDHFDPAFIAYLDKHPSQHFSVRYFGQYFSEFLKTTSPYNEFPVLAEMAEFEWSVAFTIDAPDAPIATVQQFSQIAPEKWPDLLFTLHPAVQHRHFEYDTPQLWQLIDGEEELRAPVKLPAKLCWLFWRKGQKSYFRSCNLAQEKMLQGIIAQQEFGELCEELLPILPENEIAAFAAQTLYQWVNDGMISSIKTADTD